MFLLIMLIFHLISPLFLPLTSPTHLLLPPPPSHPNPSNPAIFFTFPSAIPIGTLSVPPTFPPHPLHISSISLPPSSLLAPSPHLILTNPQNRLSKPLIFLPFSHSTHTHKTSPTPLKMQNRPILLYATAHHHILPPYHPPSSPHLILPPHHHQGGICHLHTSNPYCTTKMNDIFFLPIFFNLPTPFIPPKCHLPASLLPTLTLTALPINRPF